MGKVDNKAKIAFSNAASEGEYGAYGGDLGAARFSGLRGTGMSMPLTVLIVEDVPADAELMAHELGKAGYEVKWKRVGTEPEFKAALEDAPEVILADYSLPGFSAFRALALLHERRSDIPFIVVTATLQDEEAAAECIKLGAADYLLKDRLARLPESVRQALEKKRQHEEQENIERALREAKQLKDSIVSAALDCVITIDREGKVVDFNPAAEMTFGFKRAELIGKPMVEHLVPPRFRESHTRGFARLLATGEGPILGKRLELAALRADGTEFPIELTVTATGTWEAPLFAGHVRDITTQVLAQQALRESVERFRSFMEHLPGRASIRDPEGRYTYVNDTWARAFGMKAETVLGRTPEQLFPAERAAALGAIHHRTIETKAPQSRILRTTSDGSEQWWLSHHFPIPDAYGNTALVGTVAIDITEQKLQEEKIARLNRVHTVLSGINTLIVRVRERDELFREACRIAVDHGGFGIAWIGMLDERTQEVTPVACAGLEAAEYLSNLKSSARSDHPMGRGVVGRAVRDRAIRVENDLSKAQGTLGGRTREAKQRGYQARIALPLRRESDVVGVIVLYARERDFFTDEELKLLSELADDISFALQHIAREQQLERLSRVRAVSSAINAATVRIREREALLRETCRIASERGRFELVWIGAIDYVKQTVRPVAWTGFSEETAQAVSWGIISSAKGTLGEAMRTRRPSVRNDIEVELPAGKLREEALQKGCRSTICLPLVVGDQVTNLMVLFAAGRGFFDRDELALLDEVASNISFALESIARQEKLDRLSRIHALMAGINALIVRVRDRQELFDGACRVALEDGEFPFAWIGVLDPATQDVTPVAWSGEGAEELTRAKSSARDDIQAGKGAVGRAIRERRPIFNNDVIANTFGGPREKEILRRGFRSQITLPLLEDQTIVGTLTMYAREPNFFDEEELGLLTELAGDISFALGNISRQQKLDKLARIRAVSGEVNAAIGRIRERELLLRETCRIAGEQGKFELVWVALLDEEKRHIQPVAWTGFSPEIANAVNWESIEDPRVTLNEVVRTRRAAVRDDIEAEAPAGTLRQAALRLGCRSTVCVPFVVDEKVVAAIILFAPGRGFFDKDELALLDEVASNISFALESIAREERIERLSRIRAVLGEINAAIVRVQDRQKLFDEACRIAAEAGRFPFAWIGIVDREVRHIKPVAWAGAEEGFLSGMRGRRSLDEAPPQGHGPAARAVLEKQAVVVNDIQNDPRILRKEEHQARNINAAAYLPLLIAGESVGVLALHASEVGYFDEEEIKLVLELAGDISFALQTIEKQEQLEYLSYYDTLTGLPNRALFLDRTGQQLRGRGGETPLVALILLNLERFRNINETFGRHGGDDLLRQVAGRLEDAFRGKDYLARTGADGFGVVVRGLRDAAAVAHAIESQILECFRRPFVLQESEVRVAAKAGIAMFPADGEDADLLFRNAEAALKQARDSGSRYLFYAAEMNARAALVLSLENRLRKAVEAQQFVLHYQPKIDLTSGAVCGLEALIRWNEPGTGMVPPGSFIPVLEETGLILEVGKWVIEQALADYRAWTERGCSTPRIAVNVSAIQLQEGNFADVVIEAVKHGGNIPEALEIEITESLLMKEVDASIGKLSILRAMGIHVAMDDFGTGYSSLSYLARLPINSVKIDRSFISAMGKSAQDMAIVTAIITLARSLNLRVIAEGIETAAQSNLLKLLKCDEAQGYLYSKPLPSGEIDRFLLRNPALRLSHGGSESAS